MLGMGLEMPSLMDVARLGTMQRMTRCLIRRPVGEEYGPTDSLPIPIGWTGLRLGLCLVRMTKSFNRRETFSIMQAALWVAAAEELVAAALSLSWHRNPRMGGEPNVNSAGEGDVEDNASDTSVEQRNLRSTAWTADAGGKGSKKTTKPTKPTYSFRKKVFPSVASSLGPGTPRRSSRQSDISAGTAAKVSACCPASKAKRLAASNRSKMTARAMTMRQKTKKLPGDKKSAEEEYFRAVFGRKPKADKAKQVDGAVGDGGLGNYYQAVYGRKSIAEVDPEEHVEVVEPVTAKRMEARAGREEVRVDEVVDTQGYERVDDE